MENKLFSYFTKDTYRDMALLQKPIIGSKLSSTLRSFNARVTGGIFLVL